MALHPATRILTAATYGRSFFSYHIDQPSSVTPLAAGAQRGHGQVFPPQPNPARDGAWISWDLPGRGALVEVFSVSGRRVWTGSVTSTGNGAGRRPPLGRPGFGGASRGAGGVLLPGARGNFSGKPDSGHRGLNLSCEVRERGRRERMTVVTTGLDKVAREGLKLPGAGRAGSLCNNAVVDRDLRPAPLVLRDLKGVRLERIFSPQHGFAGEKQDNMIESRDGVHPGTGLPLISLYGRVREPEPASLEGLDALLIDVPDVGTRVYTFLSTALLCLKACARAGLPVYVLDRPNPLGGEAIEGPILRPAFSSFVGLIPVPLRHGLTAGEYCLFGASAMKLSLDLQVIPAEGWKRSLLGPDTGIPWVLPSPNLPCFQSVQVYPGQVLLEGTNLSEGRGTTRPFELWGAPWLDTSGVARETAGRLACKDTALERGFLLREVAFQPMFHKFSGETVRGFQIHVTDAEIYRPVETTVALLAAVLGRHRDRFAWKEPPYEYETRQKPIDLISGSDALRGMLEAGSTPDEIGAAWKSELEEYREIRRRFLLYN